MEEARPDPSASAAPAVPWPARRRQIRRQLVALLSTAGAAALTVLLLTLLAAALQGRRDETRSAELLVVASPVVASPELAEHIFELYRRDYVPQLLLVGEGREGLRAQLSALGVAESSMRLGGPEPGTTAQLRAAIRAARATGVETVLVTGEPSELLLWLKIARDQGVRAYGSPPEEDRPTLLPLLQAGVSYWRYALGGA